tara:strand:+ start:21 stop:1175 length:1155 start_codon:yes stop_codon:yes gene_type:complete
MITSKILFKNFKNKKKTQDIKKILQNFIEKNDQVFQSLGKNYRDNFKKKNLKFFKNYKDIKVIGIGGSSFGTKAIYSFLKYKIKKNFTFIDNLSPKKKIDKKKKYLNIIVSKSGNTIETIINANVHINKKDQNIFITENKKNYLHDLGQKLKAEIIHHNNFIGGRYSVLSETGMLPAELMGLESNKFRQFNNLIKNKKYLNALISSASASVNLIKKKKFNSVIINYDESSADLFYWYQQLVAESLGKNRSGILPIISNMPKDNHSVMQLYLDGFKNNFFTLFYVHEKKCTKILSKNILTSHNFISKKDIGDITFAQKKATERVFNLRNIPYRSFEIKKKDEKTLGELFSFFILETILIGKALKIDPYNQPAVELIKKETKKILI